MNILLSTKGGDITTWRAVENFSAAYRQALLDQAALDRDGNAEAVISETCAALEAVITAHQECVKRFDSLIGEVAAAPPSTGLKKLTAAFYSDLYRHFGLFRSAPAFYQLSMTFLCQASAAIIAHTIDQLGLSADDLPEMALIATGPAGRGEYTPFCALQILLVHGDVAASQLPAIDLFCQTLHTGFEDAGLPVDPVVTPRNASWRGTMAEWRHRCEEGLRPQADDEFFNLCRLIDQYPLHPDERFARELKEVSSEALNRSRPALARLIERMLSLSTGLGLMGRLKLERSGSERGMFRLLEHGLLPLSAALSTLALIKKIASVDTCERIRDLLKRGELDVELAERMLETWHNLHDLRLRQEQSFDIATNSSRALFLNPDELTADQRQSLKNDLESVAIIRRHVEIIFSGMGE